MIEICFRPGEALCISSGGTIMSLQMPMLKGKFVGDDQAGYVCEREKEGKKTACLAFV